MDGELKLTADQARATFGAADYEDLPEKVADGFDDYASGRRCHWSDRQAIVH